MQLTTDPLVSAASGSRAELLFPPGDPVDIRRVERVIAVARLFVSIAIVELAVAQIYPSRLGDLPLTLVLSYGGLSLIVLIALSRPGAMPSRLPIVMQLVDVAVAAIVPWSYGLNGSLMVLLVFPLLAAGYRGGLGQVLITALAVDTLIAVQWVIANTAAGLLLGGAGRAFDNRGLFTSTMFVVIAGVVVGYLAENEYRRRSEAVAISHVLAQARPGAEFDRMLAAVLRSIRGVFGARATVLVILDTRTARLFRWEVGASSGKEPVAAKEVPVAARSDYFFGVPGDAWHAVARRLWRRGAFDAVAIDAQGRRLRSIDLVFPPGFMATHPCRRVLGVSLALGEEWTSRLFIIEPAIGIRREIVTRFAQRLASHTGRVMYGYYLVHRVRTRAQATERGRIARELHDGIIQSLLGLEMEIVALRRRALAHAEASQIDADLARIQKLLQREVIGMREITEGIRAGNNASGNIVEELAEMAERFRRYTGISASFVSAQPSIAMSRHMRRQVALILHEALVNVRKHSRASRVCVKAEAGDGRFRLSIEDDGGGFPFAGRRTQPELDASRDGPRMIGERVRMIGGEMTVESRPGLGTSIEISVSSGLHHD